MNYAQWKQFLGNNLWHGEHIRSEWRHFYGSYIVQSVSMPDSSKVWLIDISHWNVPPVDLKRMVDLFGLSGVIIKGCDGSLNTRYYLEHVAAAKAAGIPWGMYVWLYRGANVNIEAQTTAWAARAKADPPPLGVWIDAEWTYYGGSPSNPTASDLRPAHDSFKSKYGKSAGTYTAPGYASQYLKGFDFTREKNWVAAWGVSTPTTWQYPYWLHQFTSTLDGKTLDPNGNAGIDGNYFNGTAAEFAAWAGTTPTPPPTGETNMEIATLKQDLNIRSGVGTSYPILYTARAGDKIIASHEAGHSWYVIDHIQAANGDGISFPVKAYCSSYVGYYSSVYPYEPAPDPDPTPTPQPFDVTVTIKREGYKDGSTTVTMEPF